MFFQVLITDLVKKKKNPFFLAKAAWCSFAEKRFLMFRPATKVDLVAERRENIRPDK